LLFFIFREQAKYEFTIVGLTGGDYGITIAISGGIITIIEAQFSFAVIRVLPVAVKAIFRKDRPDIAIKFKLTGRAGVSWIASE